MYICLMISLDQLYYFICNISCMRYNNINCRFHVYSVSIHVMLPSYISENNVMLKMF